jgi:hypothetical protein
MVPVRIGQVMIFRTSATTDRATSACHDNETAESAIISKRWPSGTSTGAPRSICMYGRVRRYVVLAAENW